MKIKDKIITIIICGIVICLYVVIGSFKNLDSNINKVYKVYLDGEVIGSITNEDDLYALIDQKQQNIKTKYNVDKVYPPKGLKIVEDYTFDNNVESVESIYTKIEQRDDFTIQGYEVRVSAADNHDAFSIYLLQKDILKEAVEDFIIAFVNKEEYESYLNGTQEQLDDIGIIYTDMAFAEDITIREKFISVNENIYDNSEDLAQELLFGFNYKQKTYTVKEGDTIESISEANTLNTQEFLIANPKFSSKDSLLSIGETVNITLIDPELSFTYAVEELKQVEYPFDNTIKRDTTKPSNFSEITLPGVKGLSIQRTRYSVVNGEPMSSAEVVEETVIRNKVDQVTTKGRQNYIGGNETFVDIGSGWRWPTNSPYRVSSEFEYRWGKMHNGLDITGTGWASNIFAANDGVVTFVFTGCEDSVDKPNSCGSGFGNHVVIDHGNNIYTLYGHMTHDIPVRVGQTVSRGQVVGHMGNSGDSQGTHLHFGVAKGDPKHGGSYFNPRSLFK